MIALIAILIAVALLSNYISGSPVMARERLYLFDTTLRDGAQTNGVDFTLADKLTIARHARRSRRRLHRGRLSRRQSDRHRLLRRAAADAGARTPPSA